MGEPALDLDLYCEKMSCRMTSAACLRRQQALARQKIPGRRPLLGTFISTDECIDCPQGEEVKKIMENQGEFKPALSPAFAKKVCKGEVCRAINPEGVEKPLDEFGPDKKSADKHKRICRRCDSWSVRKSALKKKGIQDPMPQDYVAEFGGTKQTPAKPAAAVNKSRSKKGPQKPVIPAQAGIQVDKEASLKSMVKNGLTAVRLRPRAYQKLQDVLDKAYDQAAFGKGKERHAKAEGPFESQKICEITPRVGLGYPLGQAIKQAEESLNLERAAGIQELLGAINYLAAAVIVMEEGL